MCPHMTSLHFSAARHTGCMRAKRAAWRRRRLVREADSERGCLIFFGCSFFFSLKSVWTAPRVQFDPGFGVGIGGAARLAALNPKALILLPDYASSFLNIGFNAQTSAQAQIIAITVSPPPPPPPPPPLPPPKNKWLAFERAYCRNLERCCAPFIKILLEIHFFPGMLKQVRASVIGYDV